MPKGERKQYTKEFRLSAVYMMLGKEFAPEEICAMLMVDGIHVLFPFLFCGNKGTQLLFSFTDSGLQLRRLNRIILFIISVDHFQ